MRKIEGSVALTTLVLVVAILFGLSLSVIHSAADLGFASKAYSVNTSTKVLARACLEETLFQVREDESYIGSFSLGLNGGGCDVTVSNTANPNEKSVDVTATEGGYYSDYIWKMDTSTTPFGINIE